MAKISSYNINSYNPDAIIIGTEPDSLETKNYRLGDIIGPEKYKGSFYHASAQVASAINTAKAITLGSVDSDNTYGFSIVDGTKITAANDGSYNLAFSAQLKHTGGGEVTVDIWLRVDGVNVSNTNTSITLKSNANYAVAAWNFFVKLNAGQYAELMWATTDVAATMPYEAANAVHPATPSVIATINQI